MSERTWKLVRDTALILLGAFILLHETLGSSPPDALLVGAALGLFGLPLPLRLDAKRKRNGNGGE